MALRDFFVSSFSPQYGNQGALIHVNASHPPDFVEIKRKKYLQPPEDVQAHGHMNLKLELCDKNLWEKFAAEGTEMIVTKSGRRMFPGYRVMLSGLLPDTKYCLLMDIVNVDEHRYKYQQGEWMVAGRGERHSLQNVFVHPDSPAEGKQWMSSIVSFHKVKLTNSTGNYPSTKTIVLNSMHRYIPRIHVVAADDVNTIQHKAMSTFSFPATVFITVTAYQNAEVTKLKIDNNPFAKGFRDHKRSSEIKPAHDLARNSNDPKDNTHIGSSHHIDSNNNET